MRTKQVIVIRRDLNMRRGKEIAQGAHASGDWMASRLIEINQSFFLWLAISIAGLGGVLAGVGVVLGGVVGVIGVGLMVAAVCTACRLVLATIGFTPEEKDWLFGLFTKVTVQVPGEAELMEVYRVAREAGLRAVAITDSGVTEFHGEHTVTAVAIGPHDAELINPFTGHLKIY